MKISLKQLFILSFAFTIIVKAMDGIPFIEKVPSYFFYAFCIIWGLLYLVLGQGKIRGLNTRAIKIIFLLLVYFIIWGCLLIAPTIELSDPIREMMRRCAMLVFILVSTLWISKYNCIKQVMHYSYMGLLFLMLSLFLINLGSINLVRTLSTFWQMSDTVRQRTLFSFGSNNIAAELAMSVILLSIYELSSRKALTLKKIMILLSDAIMFLIIIANNSRGTVVAAFAMLLVYIILKLNKKYSTEKLVKTGVVLLILVFLGLGYYLKSVGLTIESLFTLINRQHLFANIEILNASGRQWIGLGNLSGAFFKENSFLFGRHTDYMEMFYAGVYVRSGIIGAIIVLGIIVSLLLLIARVGRSDTTFLGKWILLIYSYMLFVSLFEQYLFSSGYASSILFLTIIISYIQSAEMKSRRNQSNLFVD